jgi:uncharacterized membrane protein
MTFEPLLAAPFIVQLHVASAIPAIVVGPFAIFARTSWKLHKIMGYIWVVSMAVLSVSGLFIPTHGAAVLGHFGPIHLFCVFGIWGITNGIWLARQRRIAEHRSALKWTWFGAMGAAGIANFLPGRTINQMAFGDASEAGWIVMAIGAALMVFLWCRDRGQLRSIA